MSSFTPQAVTLPPRKGQLTYPDDHVKAVADLVAQANVGQGIQVDEAQDSITKSSTRSERMKVQLANQHNLAVKAHNIERDGQFIPAVSKKKAKKENTGTDGAPAAATTTPQEEDKKGKK